MLKKCDLLPQTSVPGQSDAVDVARFISADLWLEAFSSERTVSASVRILNTPCLLAEPPSTRSTTLYRLLPSFSLVVSITLNLACMVAFPSLDL